MGISDFFKRKVAEREAKGYTPKFKPGDIILNKKYIIVRRVVSIRPKSVSLSNQVEYVLKDIHNPLKDKNSIKQFNVYKVCLKIDDYYDKISEQSAKILYGHKE